MGSGEGNRSNHCEENGGSSTHLNLKIVLFKLFLKRHCCVYSYVLLWMHCDYALVTINHHSCIVSLPCESAMAAKNQVQKSVILIWGHQIM